MSTMRHLSLVAVVALIVFACSGVPRAQGGRRSPHESTSATVDGSEMFIEYGRPYMRGREIFGRLVRFGDVWCPGADEATMLSTSRSLKFGTLEVPAGEYSLWILPTEDTWTLIFNRNAHTFHTQYRSRADLGRVELQKTTLNAPVEQLTFTIEKNDSGPGGRITMSWATTEVAAAFVVE
jgi:hypothetical protein